MTEITAILNVHREGILAHSSLLSIAGAQKTAEAAGIGVEVLAIADCSDRITLDTLALAPGIQVLETSVGDLGLARNVGVAAAKGRYIAFLDGDDLWGRCWLRAAYEAATTESRPVVWHPEACLYFGSKHEPSWLIHPEMEAIEGDWVTLGVRNQWTSLSFAPRTTYLEVPYPRTNLAGGFGLEDWSWNSEVVAHGYLHKPVPGTAHLVRVQANSLVRRTGLAKALVTPSSLFRSRIGWAARVGTRGIAASSIKRVDARAIGGGLTNGKRILVTGAAGFIGSHLTEALVRGGAKVTAMVRYNSASSIGNLAFLPQEVREGLTIAAGNIEDSDFVFRAMEGQDIVLHLAALIAIPYSYVAPRSYFRVNVEGTLNVLEAARRLRTERVVHTSTSEVYGTALRTPIEEDHPLQGQSPYSASKIGADKIVESYFRSFDTPVVTIRPFNTFGPRQSARAFIPTIVSQALSRDAVRLGALAPQRDMTYVADTVDGFLRAAVMSEILGETINLGTGEAFSIGEFATRILSLMGCRKPIVHDAARVRPEKSEVMKLVSDNRKAARLMQWKPATSLDDGLRRVIEFVSMHPELYAPEGYTV